MQSFQRTPGLLFAASLAVLTLTAIPARTSTPASQAVSIAQARKLPVGTTVTVDGTVSTPSGAFQSSFSDEGFALQDKTAGIYVSTPTNLHVAPPKHASVTGVLTDHSGLLVIVPANTVGVKTRDGSSPVVPQAIRTADVGETTEGRIVWVKGKVSQAPASDGPYGFKFSVNDGSGEALIFVNVQTNIDMKSLALGENVRVTGFSSQYDTHYEIDPRRPEDIAKLK